MVTTHCGYLTMNTHWILTAVLHMAALIQTGESCMVSVTPTLVFATMGEILTFNCNSTCASLSWETRFKKKSSPPLRTSTSTQVVEVDSWPESNTTCLDNDFTGDDVPRAIATVIPYALPSRVEIDVQKEMEEGQDYEVTCHVIDVAPVRLVTVELHINNETILTQGNEEDERIGKKNMNKTFTITANRQQTEFHCLAIMNLTGIANTTVSSSVTEVSVLYPPKFTSCPKSLFWVEGRNTTFNCSAEGNPPPTVLCNGQNREFYSPSDLNLTRDESGVYKCEASNRLNTTHRLVNIEVQYPSGSPEVLNSANSTIRSGASVNLSCNADARPPPQYRWIVPPGATVTYSPDKRTITIESASSAHNGNYTCVVSNAHGHSEGWTHVKVEKDAQWWIYIVLGIALIVVVVALAIGMFISNNGKKGFYDLMGWNEKSNTTLPLEEKNNDTLLPITDPTTNLPKH